MVFLQGFGRRNSSVQSTPHAAADDVLLALGAVMLMGEVVRLIAAVGAVQQRPF